VIGLSKDDKILWRFMSDDNVPLTNNEAEPSAAWLCAVA
jgi:hypothetical protein